MLGKCRWSMVVTSAGSALMMPSMAMRCDSASSAKFSTSMLEAPITIFDGLMHHVSLPKLTVPGLKFTTASTGLKALPSGDALVRPRSSVEKSKVPLRGMRRCMVQSTWVSTRLSKARTTVLSPMSPFLVGNWVVR